MQFPLLFDVIFFYLGIDPFIWISQNSLINVTIIKLWASINVLEREEPIMKICSLSRTVNRSTKSFHDKQRYETVVKKTPLIIKKQKVTLQCNTNGYPLTLKIFIQTEF